MRKAAFFFLLLAACAAPLWAGTDVKARLESYTYKEAWVEVEVLIGDGHLRLDFQGPWAHGSLLYDRETSLVTVVDDIHKTVLPLAPDNQAALKLIAQIASARFQAQNAGSLNGSKALQMARENAKAFFNGIPALKGKGIRKAGFACDEYRTELEWTKAREIWVTTPDQAGMSGEDYNTLRSLAHLAVDLCGDELAEWGADTAPFQQALDIPQVPVREVLYVKGKPSSLFQVLSMKHRAFGAETFAAPSGYQEISLLDLFKQGSPQAGP